MNTTDEEHDSFLTSDIHKDIKRIGSASLPWARYDKKFSIRGRSYSTVLLSDSEEYLLSRQIFTGLDFSFNRLNTLDMGIFSHFPHLMSITKLDLSCNEIENLPLNLDILRNLTHLDLHSNNIKVLVPCFANMKNLVWFNVNRNPINSLIPGFRKVVGPMATDQECKLAAQRVIAWMAGQLKDHDQLQVGDELLLQKLQRRGIKSKMRDLCGGSRLAESASERLIVIRPEGCAPFAAQVLNPLNLSRSSQLKFSPEKSWSRSGGLTSAILWSASAFLVFSLIFTEDEFSKLLSVIDFMPTWFLTLCGTVHATIQSIYKFWLPGLAPIGWSRLLETSAEAMQTFTEFLKFGGPDPNSITGDEL